ncbi:MAG: AMIN domain-containing protein, partial [Candidatus Aenigmarchaeota archaeon]|nr:AMIN domain-containing protein [Candidatus Aenigmarchaeota archaeon]
MKDLSWNPLSSFREPDRVPFRSWISRATSRTIIVLFLFSVSLLLGNLWEPPVAKAKEKLARALKGVSVTKRGKITEVTITADGLIRDYNAFTLESPPRLVIDLWNLKNLFPKNVVYARRSHLKRIRIGIHSKKTRVVLDFSGPRLPPYRIDRFQKKLVVLLGDIKAFAA